MTVHDPQPIPNTAPSKRPPFGRDHQSALLENDRHDLIALDDRGRTNVRLTDRLACINHPPRFLPDEDVWIDKSACNRKVQERQIRLGDDGLTAYSPRGPKAFSGQRNREKAKAGRNESYISHRICVVAPSI